MANDDVSDDAAYKAFVQTLVKPRNNDAFNDDIDNSEGRIPIQRYYDDYIRTPNTTTDEQFDEMRRKGPVNRMLNANDRLSDAIQTDPDNPAQTPLDTLIPKIASGKHTKQDMLDFLNLTGTPL